MKKDVSSSDVAREAGVSRATVSYILNKVEGICIKPETRAKVLEASRKLGYHPDSNARALKTNRSMSIGVATRRDISDERFSKILKGIKEVLSPRGYSIVLCSDESDTNEYPEYYNYFREKKIDGVLLISYIEKLNKEHTNRHIELIEKSKIPAVFIDYHLMNPMLNCVDINYFHGAYIATKELYVKGYRNIVYIAPKLGTVQEYERCKGVEQAINDQNDSSVRLEKVFINSGETIDDKLMLLLETCTKGSVLVFSWSSHAFKALYHANKFKKGIPEEIAFLSLGSSNYAESSYPKLSTSDLPLYDIGKRSAELLVNSMNVKDLPLNITLPCTFNIRETC